MRWETPSTARINSENRRQPPWLSESATSTSTLHLSPSRASRSLIGQGAAPCGRDFVAISATSLITYLVVTYGCVRAFFFSTLFSYNTAGGFASAKLCHEERDEHGQGAGALLFELWPHRDDGLCGRRRRARRGR